MKFRFSGQLLYNRLVRKLVRRGIVFGTDDINLVHILFNFNRLFLFIKVAYGSLTDIAVDKTQNDQLAQICVTMHESVDKMSGQLYAEYHRHFYTTPSCK